MDIYIYVWYGPSAPNEWLNYRYLYSVSVEIVFHEGISILSSRYVVLLSFPELSFIWATYAELNLLVLMEVIKENLLLGNISRGKPIYNN